MACLVVIGKCSSVKAPRMAELSSCLIFAAPTPSSSLKAMHPQSSKPLDSLASNILCKNCDAPLRGCTQRKSNSLNVNVEKYVNAQGKSFDLPTSAKAITPSPQHQKPFMAREILQQ